ncbi:H-NS histone family protein [Glaciimonas soli]|uniref:H-NS histone family protein n=1 Tax=Glaciimonas soli TaxID=2590999 RepID=A0A843YXN9_9BURK|nr:H-NS histone family protein [Glaciimonas soli]MQR01316.1 H-NS histone family protein [Glaciimonas soli]
MDLSNLSVADLRTLQEQIKQALKEREHEEKNKAREQILAIAQGAGISLKDLLGNTRVKSGVAKKVAVRYRNPNDASLQWTGRGRQPKWVQEWLASGKTLDALHV